MALHLAVAALLLGGCATAGGAPSADTAPVRVLVDLAVSSTAAPGTAISAAQAAVIAALPADQTRVVRRYATVPLLALEVSPSMVPMLLRLPQVTAVRPDQERTIDQ